MKTQYLIASEAGLFKSGLYGWVTDIERATRFDTAEQARACMNLYHPEQRKTLAIWEEIEVDGQLAHAEIT